MLVSFILVLQIKVLFLDVKDMIIYLKIIEFTNFQLYSIGLMIYNLKSPFKLILKLKYLLEDIFIGILLYKYFHIIEHTSLTSFSKMLETNFLRPFLVKQYAFTI